MMHLKLLKDKNNYYEYGNCVKKELCSNLEMHILEVFLLCDVIRHYKIYLELVYNPKSYGGIGDTTCIEKEDGYIYLSDGIFEPQEGQEPLRFKMSMHEFEHLMLTWGTKILVDDEEKRPSEVLIRYENEKFFFDIKE